MRLYLDLCTKRDCGFACIRGTETACFCEKWRRSQGHMVTLKLQLGHVVLWYSRSMVGWSICPAYLLAGWVHHSYLQRYEPLNHIFSTDLSIQTFGCQHLHIMDCRVCFSVAWHCLDRDADWKQAMEHSSSWRVSAAEEGGWDWQPGPDVAASLVPASPAGPAGVGMFSLHACCAIWLLKLGCIFSLPRNCNPQPPHVIHTRESSSGVCVS